MKDSNEKSLKVIHESIFDKIKRFISRMMKKEEKNVAELTNSYEIEIETEPKEEELTNEKTQETIKLIKRIEKEEINLEEKDNTELEQINENLTRYLNKIQKEINSTKSEKKIVENQIKNYQEQMAKYKERMAN